MLRKLIVGTIVVNFVFMLAGVLTTFDHNSNIGVALANTTATFGTGAQVDQFLAINAVLKTVEWNSTSGKYDINWNTNPGSLNYGTLVPVTNNQTGEFYYMAGANAYAVIMYPVSNAGSVYYLKQSGTVLQSAGGATIPDAAYVMTPDYQNLDQINGQNQGEMPGNAALAGPQSAVGNNHLIYTSDAAGSTRAVRAFLAITGPNEQGYIRNWSKGYNSSNPNPDGQWNWYHGGGGQNNWQPVLQSQPAGQYSGSVTVTVNL